MEFDLPKDQSSIIKVIGVGGGGGNAVNHMYNQGIKGVDFIICNTDQQALDISSVPIKIQLGASLTEGRGAGAIPEIGKNAAIENIEEIKDILGVSTKMVFITAGMGGGTGTGAAPVIAKVAKEMGILTVGIVTVPFGFEGRKRKIQAEEGLEELRRSVDTLLIINNDRLRDMFGNLSLGNAFSQADNVLATAAKGIAEVISVTGAINVDFNDVNTVMRDSGVAIMGSATAEGENRAMDCVKRALSSPLLNDNDITGARYVLLNITYGTKEVLMDEIGDITDYIQDEAGSTADVIWGHGQDDSLGEGLCVTLIATGFNTSPVTGFEKEPEKKMHTLEDAKATVVSQPIESPVQEKNDYVEPATEVQEPYEEPFLKVKEEDTEQTEINWTFNENVNQKAEEVEPETEEKEEVIRHYLTDEIEEKIELETTAPKVVLSKVEQERRAKERMERIQTYTSKLKSSNGINDLEKEPAYKRRDIRFDDVAHSSDEPKSKFTVSETEENGEKRFGLRENNSFLHDNVD
ncbi:cell division protein FtsZ [Putridiphycobacter roseus]|uniref:Cell division protein FtsZ n=1 Tax=Putridiphycobacter roseus TaxID=2219161 RepID=A0A2W1NSD6_9FLAO|nr:cell division protein FtsZ [Putridiphycobacter roseus]PZE18562.1 cell division protein FtsZ [Putridiphycobacter roseus]